MLEHSRLVWVHTQQAVAKEIGKHAGGCDLFVKCVAACCCYCVSVFFRLYLKLTVSMDTKMLFVMPLQHHLNMLVLTRSDGIINAMSNSIPAKNSLMLVEIE